MIIYNVTTRVATAVFEGWLDWMRSVHIPEIMATGLITEHKIVRLLDVEEDEGPTIAVQYYLKSYDDYEKYIADHSDRLRLSSYEKWGDRVISFRTVMEVIN